MGGESSYLLSVKYYISCLKSHDHEIWHVGPLSDLELHGPSRILIFGTVAPQTGAAFSSLLSTRGFPFKFERGKALTRELRDKNLTFVFLFCYVF